MQDYKHCIMLRHRNLLSLRSLKLLNKRTCTSAPTLERPLILGIETSCDDTGAAIVSRNGTILGESHHSQLNQHLRNGGIIPPIAADLHRQNIERVVNDAFTKANLTLNDVDAIAVTNRPGLVASLTIGVRYAKHLARTYHKPMIPIHHMEAHALTARINNVIPFPFLCLLASGGHCILTLVKGVQEFYMLGETADVAPGDAFDKTARRLKLRNLREYRWMNGGRAIEVASSRATNVNQFNIPLPLAGYRDCSFSFSGIQNKARRYIEKSERNNHLAPDEIIPDYENLCAAVLRISTKHIVHRTQRAVEFCEFDNLISDETGRRLVFSGGVACNDFIFDTLTELCDKMGYQIWRPSKQHCTDNGVMIAWNGVERWLDSEDTYHAMDLDDVVVEPGARLGKSLVDKIAGLNLTCDWVKLSTLRNS